MDDKEFYLDAIKGIVPEQKEVQLQNVFYSFLEIEHLYDSAISCKCSRADSGETAKPVLCSFPIMLCGVLIRLSIL